MLDASLALLLGTNNAPSSRSKVRHTHGHVPERPEDIGEAAPKAAMIQDVQEAFMTELDAAFATLPTHTREQTTHGNELRIRLTFK